MILLLLAALQPPAAADPVEARFDACTEAVARDAAEGLATATRWQAEGGGVPARQCEGLAHAAADAFPQAAAAFEQAAAQSAAAGDGRTARLWVQAGNAHLAGGQAVRALAAFDAALALGGDGGEMLGEIHLDRGRALVALDRPGEARAALDQATALAPRDPLGWLLSATLHRRQGALGPAKAAIDEAARRAPDDATVATEAGAIAILSGDEAAARTHWQTAIRLQPTSSAAQRAREMLARLDPGVAPAEPATR